MTLSYAESLDYIYSFTDYEVEPQYRYAPDVHDPARPAHLLALLGNPHLAYPTIHIAGSKGKGSVAAICASALRAAGRRTGLYTSPHLQSFTERIQVDGRQISPAEVAELIAEIRPTVDQIEGITTFEIITALAFLYYARQQVEAAVIEVGMGGRLDATNVVRPLVSVITSLGYEHTHLLGETLTEIAAEKGGIIKSGAPLVSAPQKAEALAVLESMAAERNAPLTLVGRDWWYELGATDFDGQTFRAGRAGRPGTSYRLPLLGQHQALNATVALATLDVAQARIPALDDEAIRRGLAQVSWPGRFQILNRRPVVSCRKVGATEGVGLEVSEQNKPLSDSFGRPYPPRIIEKIRPVVVVDGAHTGDSVGQLRQTLEAIFPDNRLLLVFGVTADKDVTQIIQTLMPIADETIVTAAGHPRAAKPADLRRQLEAQGFAALQSPTVSSALSLALEMAGPDDVICITGSLFVVGDALTAWFQVGARQVGE